MAQGLVASVLRGPLLEGKTRLVATELYSVVQVSDQMVWMRDGRFNEAGEPAPVLQVPNGPACRFPFTLRNVCGASFTRNCTRLLHPTGEMMSLAHPFVRDIFHFISYS